MVLLDLRKALARCPPVAARIVPSNIDVPSPSTAFLDACAAVGSPSASPAMVDVFQAGLEGYVHELRDAGVPPHRFLIELRPIFDGLGTRGLQTRALAWAIAAYYAAAK
jgi:hypothetical protein